MANSPTLAVYAGLQQAYDHFNRALFGGQLSPCLITLRSSPRTYGYHHKDRFINRQGQLIDELGLHPGFFTLRPVEEVLATLVHEMVHHWQGAFGQPSKSTPHNRQWAEKMRSIGLEPSSTGLPQGKATGQTVSHYILPDGPYIQACRALLQQGFALHWFDRHVPRGGGEEAERRQALAEAGVVVEVSAPPLEEIPAPADGKSIVVNPPMKTAPERLKFVCLACGTKAWAAPEVLLLCGTCHAAMQAAG